MPNLPACPQCTLENTYADGDHYVCADCGFEWRGFEWPLAAATDADAARVVKDAHGNVLADGDSVTLIKDLKVKGSSITLKVGTRIKNIRIVDGDHEIDCKTDAGPMLLKAAFLKKA